MSISDIVRNMSPEERRTFIEADNIPEDHPWYGKTDAQIRGFIKRSQNQKGKPGNKKSSDTIEAIKVRQKGNKAALGTIRSKEFRENVGKEKSKPVLQFTKCGKFVAEYPSVSLAAKAVNRDPAAITMCCKGHTKSCAKFIWKYKEEESRN